MVNAAAIANLYRRSSFCTLTLATIFPAESNGRAEGRGRARRALACAHTRRKLCFESLETHCASHEISHRRRFCIDHIVRGDRDTENFDLVQIHPVYRPVDFNMDQNLYVESNFVQPKPVPQGHHLLLSLSGMCCNYAVWHKVLFVRP